MMKSKKSIFINIGIILVVLVIVLYFSLKDNFNEIMNYILKMNPIYFILGIMCLIIYRSLVGLSSYTLVKLNKSHINLIKSIQINFIILFFHGVTPFAGGGQPMEIYYLHKEGIDTTKATNVVIQNFILYQVALILIGIVAVVYNNIMGIFPSNSVIRRLVILGFVINVLVLVVSIILAFSKKLSSFICNTVISFLNKIRIIKDKDKTIKNFSNYLDNFNKNMKMLIKNKRKVLFIVCINFLALFSLYSIPYMVALGMGKSLNYFTCVFTTTYTMIMGSFVPIPGGTGGVEYGFVYFFGHIIKGSILNAIMLVWRFISYYMGTIIGAICLMFYRKKE